MPSERKIAEPGNSQRIRISTRSELFEIETHTYQSILGHAVECDAQKTARLDVSDKLCVEDGRGWRRHKTLTFIARDAPTAAPENQSQRHTCYDELIHWLVSVAQLRVGVLASRPLREPRQRQSWDIEMRASC